MQGHEIGYYAVRTRDGLYAIYGVEGASAYLGVADTKPAGMSDPPRNNRKKAEAMRMDAYKRNKNSLRYDGPEAWDVFEKLGAKR